MLTFATLKLQLSFFLSVLNKYDTAYNQIQL